MKQFLVILLGLLCSNGHGQSWPFEESIAIFNPKEIDVRWEIPKGKETNSIKIYKVVPNHFSESTISNLLVLGKLSETNKTTPFEKRDKTARCWISKENKSMLQVIPNMGMVDLRVERPNKIGAEGDLVPPVRECTIQSVNLLAKLFGISTNELAHKDGKLNAMCSEGDLGTYNKTLKKPVRCIQYRSIYLDRAIDKHMLLTTDNIANIEFVDYGQVSRLQLKWCNLELINTIPHPTIDNLKEVVAMGRARTTANLESPTKLVLNDMDYYYIEKRTAGQTLYYPYMRLIGTLYNSTTNSPVFLFCEVPERK